MDYGSNLDQFSAHPIDDSIVFEDELSEFLSSVFRHHPTRPWELTQLFYLGDDALNEEARSVSG